VQLLKAHVLRARLLGRSGVKDGEQRWSGQKVCYIGAALAPGAEKPTAATTTGPGTVR
jgi:hypothetical protein